MESSLLQGFEIVGTPSDVDGPDALSDQGGLCWLPASVPGGVHETLHGAGVIGHPYFGANDAGARWVEDLTWWYRAQFPGNAARHTRVTLILHGVDTVATVWFNGHLLGRHESQFRAATFDVTDVITFDNELLIRFGAPLAGLEAPDSVVRTNDRVRALMAAAMPPDQAGAKEQAPGVLSGNPAMTLRRKATFSW